MSGPRKALRYWASVTVEAAKYRPGNAAMNATAGAVRTRSRAAGRAPRRR
ncbi:hypothetical protein [Amycolatopsis sp. MtRt-6]|nr:hypothetical protein [Amycolatopsis sp. MtRt-6]